MQSAPAPVGQQGSKIYESLPLDPSTFSTRLLTILPGATDNAIKCRLRSTRINANTSYEALSYTWGDAHLCRNIIVNGQQFAVTTNLEQALRALRRCDRRRTIWVDAVCIDQSDLLEKSVYVRGMGYIYRLAKQVIIWLGPEGSHTSQVFQCIQHNELKHKPPPLPSYEPEFVWDAEVRDLILQWKEYRALEAQVAFGVEDLTSRQWWSRVWVVQELCMAAGDPLLVCGQSTMPWSQFTRFVQSMAMASKHQLHIARMNELRQRARYPPRVRNPDSANDYATSLLEDDLHWLRYTATFEASDPRDKIFALMGLMRGPLRTQINIDYKASVEDLTMKLMADQITVHRSLSLLALCHDSHRTDRPSWLPDFITPGLPPLPSTMGPLEQLESRVRFTRTRARITAKAQRARASFTVPQMEISGRETVCNWCPGNSPMLAASGSLFGHVQSVIARHEESPRDANLDPDDLEILRESTEGPSWGQLHSFRRRHAALDTVMKINDLERCNALLMAAGLVTTPLNPLEISASNSRELLATAFRLQHDLSNISVPLNIVEVSECKRLLNEYQRLLNQAVAWAGLHCHWYPLFSKLAATDMTEGFHPQNADALLCWEISEDEIRAGESRRASILHAMEGRQQFTTDTGLIGLGPREMRKDDEIVVFDASSFAFAIRQTGEEYTLIGQVLICPPIEAGEYPVEEWVHERPTDFPASWKEPTRHEFLLE
ncbi:hypothetical protein PRZ48_003331 [Zasmidium cellare]|uniref:Heterokaryon incompatibility domain-containing protein n=1 Tax=Zasmidium cellare TaxID=395010 RepID=A0ABR0EW19_ZASCE|nr:hypothetical protein PRZ48_003331 [Zasmidium cellare]